VDPLLRIHHLNCGTLCPFGERFISGEGGLGSAEIVCHCLLIEAGGELVLVDTGFGTEDARHPCKRLGAPFNLALRPKPREAETAVARIRALGLDPADVRHITVTHLDLDHAGGLPDFPEAEVHVFAAEQRAALDPALSERGRYRRPHFEHGPRWVTYDSGGDEWFGFESIRVMEAAGAEIAMIPLPGHSRGHVAIAVQDADRWLLHCGDCYFHHNEMAQPPSCPPALRAFQTMMAFDNSARKRNASRLRELAGANGDEVTLFCAHDPVDLHRLQG
jgi:glyoxylase-like metal-dependent hydrolase (beta-lactamase superfamily II)